MTVHQGKTKKNVAILSTLHQNITIADSAKKTPESVKACNNTKYGVDIVDQMARKYTVRTSTRRWPFHLFQNTLELAVINAWIVYNRPAQHTARVAFYCGPRNGSCEHVILSQITFKKSICVYCFCISHIVS